MPRSSLWCLAAVLAFASGCNLFIPAAPEQRQSLPEPCAEGQVPLSGPPWKCGAPSSLRTLVKADSAQQVAYAATADFAQEVDHADVADIALGVSPDATVELGTAPEPITGGSPAGLTVHGAAYVQGAPVRFAVGSFDVTSVADTPVGTPTNQPVASFTLPKRPLSSAREADDYALQVRLTGTVSGAGNPVANEYSHCQVSVSLSGPASFPDAATAEAGAFGMESILPAAFSLYGEGNLPHVPAGTYSMNIRLTTVDGAGTPKCAIVAGESRLRIAIDGT